MNLKRLSYDPFSAIGFFEQGISALGALSERTWHDRLEVVAEGRSARVWGDDLRTHSGELHFVSPDTGVARDAVREVFPGCPLLFRLAEALRPVPLTLDRVIVSFEELVSPPAIPVAEKLWRAQFPESARWRLASAFKLGFHFSLLCLARCEIQAMDQHWSLHRIAASLGDGTLDEDLVNQFDYAPKAHETKAPVPWPVPDPVGWRSLLERAILEELETSIVDIKARQQRSLARELERVDRYFESYIRELNARAGRARSDAGGAKSNDRVAAAKVEHGRRRADQILRHEIRVIPHLDALLLIAEPAWEAEVEADMDRRPVRIGCQFLPRARRWIRPSGV